MNLPASNLSKRTSRRALAMALACIAFNSLAGGGNTEESLQLFEASLPGLRALHPDLYDTPEKLQVAWSQFRQNLALAETARKKGYADSPEMRTRFAQMLAQEVILKEAETARPLHSITDAQLKSYFETDKEKYDLPAMLGAHEIVLRYDPADPEQRERQRAKAKELVKTLGSQPVELRSFQEIVKANSDTLSFHTNGGSLGLFPAREHRGQKPPLPEAAVAALLELKQVGRVTDVLDDGHVLRILRLSAYREAVPPRLETYKESIRRDLYLKARAQRIEELARESGWDPTAKLSDESLQRLLRSALSAGVPTDLPPTPDGLGIPAPGAPSKRP